jgi:hypothetical protein
VKPKVEENRKPLAQVGATPRVEEHAKPQADVGAKPKAAVGAKPRTDVGAKPKPDGGAKPKPEERPKPSETHPAPAVEDRRIAPPTQQAQAKARNEIAQLFRNDYAGARDRDHQLALAEKLYQQATQTRDDPAAGYVLYIEARDIAVAAGDVELLEKALTDLGRAYRVNVEAMTVEILVKAAKQPRDLSVGRDLPRTATVEMLVKAAKQLWDPAVNRDLGRMAVKKAAESMRRGEFDAAESLAESAKAMAFRVGDGATFRRATALVKEVQEHRRREKWPMANGR